MIVVWLKGTVSQLQAIKQDQRRHLCLSTQKGPCALPSTGAQKVQSPFSHVSVCQPSELPRVRALHILFTQHSHKASSFLFLFLDRGTSRISE